MIIDCRNMNPAMVNILPVSPGPRYGLNDAIKAVRDDLHENKQGAENDKRTLVRLWYKDHVQCQTHNVQHQCEYQEAKDHKCRRERSGSGAERSLGPWDNLIISSIS